MAKLIRLIMSLLVQIDAQKKLGNLGKVAWLESELLDAQWSLFKLVKNEIKENPILMVDLTSISFNKMSVNLSLILHLAQMLCFLQEDPLTEEGQQSQSHQIEKIATDISYKYDENITPLLQKLDEMHQQKIQEYFQNLEQDDEGEYQGYTP